MDPAKNDGKCSIRWELYYQEHSHNDNLQRGVNVGNSMQITRVHMMLSTNLNKFLSLHQEATTVPLLGRSRPFGRL